MDNINNLAVGNVSSAQCWKALENSEDSYLVDVRAPEEWQESGIADLSSINKEVNLLTWIFFTPYVHHNDKFIDELENVFPDKSVKLYFMCKSGGRSAQAANAAFSKGYKNSYNIDDGFIGNMFDSNLVQLDTNGWINSGLPRRAL